MPAIMHARVRAMGKAMTMLFGRGRSGFERVGHGAALLAVLLGWSLSAAADGGPGAASTRADPPVEPTVVLDAPAAGTTRTVQVGGRDIVLAVPADYVVVSEHSADMLAHFQSIQPPENRVVDVFLDDGDLRRIQVGMSARELFYQITVVRRVESIDVTKADWPTVRGHLRATMGIDEGTMQEVMDDAGDVATRHLQKKIGVDVEVKIGRVGQPQIYGGKTGPLKFWLQMPLQLSYDKEVVNTAIAATAVAAVNVRDRVVMIAAYRLYDAANDGAEVRAALDAMVAKIEALNADAPAR